MATLLAAVGGLRVAHPLAWATAGIALYSIYDYWRVGMPKLRGETDA